MTIDEIYVFELYVAVLAIPQLRDEPPGRQAILFVDNEADCATLTKGEGKNEMALMLVCAM